jgi:outer membrane lipoprotein carrier protein
MTKYFLALLMLLGIAVSAFAADPAVEAMETLRRGFAGTNDFTADITQEKHLSLMKKKMVSKGVVRFRKPDTFFMELLPPHPSRLLLKDNVMTMRLPEQAVTEKVVLPPEEGLKKWFAFLGKPIISLPEGVEVKAERRGPLWNVRIFPKSKGAVQQLVLTFDLEGKISRIVIDEHNKDQTILSFKNVRRNVGLQERDFKVE